MNKANADALMGLMLTAFEAVSETSRKQDKTLQSLLSKLEVHPAQYSCLFIICNNEGINLRDLAKKLKIENSTASVTVKRMEKSGLIKRETDTDDNRMVRLYVTEFGWDQYEQAKEVILEYLENSYGQFSEDELQLMVKLLGKLTGSTNNWHGQLSFA